MAAASAAADLDSARPVVPPARPRWSAARVEALPGRCRGKALAGWAAASRRRFGDIGVARLRRAAGSLVEDLPEEPAADAWFPVGVQLRLTDALVDELLGGDEDALEEILRAEVEDKLGRLDRMLLRGLGPGVLLRRAESMHRQLYDVGHVRSLVEGSRATIVARGAQVFANPTWQRLQVIAHRLLVTSTGRRPIDTGIVAAEGDEVVFRVGWR